MTEEQLQVIKMRAKYATDGPWKVVKSEEFGMQIGTAWEHGQLKAGVPIVTTEHGIDGVTVYINKDNAEFIANAREDVPALLQQVTSLQDEYERMKQSRNHWHSVAVGRRMATTELKDHLDRTELAEVKARMEIEALGGYFNALIRQRDRQLEGERKGSQRVQAENEQLREALTIILEDEAPNCDGYETLIHATARKALAGESND
ncbi:hypothetical protein ACTHOQ_14170 [Solibacillus silvestris]|uniref:hypothetical protein n=1 Tax=Solibacillus silvestris TaxID=76853 RepID=UPI003F7E5232